MEITLLSYDIQKLHHPVKKALASIGYLDKFPKDTGPELFFLPKTTVWHPSKSSDQAMRDLKAICAQLHVKLGRAITLKASDVVFAKLDLDKGWNVP